MLFTLGRLPCPTAAEATGGLKDWPTPGFPPGHSAPSGAAPLPPCHLPTVIHTDNRADALKPRWPPSLQPCGAGSSPATVHGPALGPAQRQGHSSVLRVLPNLEDHAVSSVINPLETSLPPSCLLPVLQDPSLSLCSGVGHASAFLDHLRSPHPSISGPHPASAGGEWYPVMVLQENRITQVQARF